VQFKPVCFSLGNHAMKRKPRRWGWASILPTGHERVANDLYWKRLPGLCVLSLQAQSRTDSYPLPRMAWPTRCLDPL